MCPNTCLSICARIEKLFGDREEGGLSLGCIRAKNLAMLFKWRWRWLQEPDGLWAKVVALGYEGEPGSLRFRRESCRWSVWKDVSKGVGEVESLGAKLKNIVRQVMGMGSNTLFWDD